MVKLVQSGKIGKTGRGAKIDNNVKGGPNGYACAPVKVSHFSALTCFTILAIRIDFNPAGFSILPFPAPLPVLPFYHFANFPNFTILAHLSVSPFAIRIDFRSWRF